MTRQLSEISSTKGFEFRITSLNPINPHNKVTPFEEKALKYIERTNEKEYYEINDNSKFNYMGVLITKAACLPCHKHQGYKTGDIRGGISISIDSIEYYTVTSSIKNRALILKVFVILFLLSIVTLVYKQLRQNEKLQSEVNRRTKEIESTKQLLQQIIDTDSSFIILADVRDVIYANKTILEFAGYSSIDEFKANHKYLSELFEKVDGNKNFLQTYNDGIHWIDYLRKEQNSKKFKILIKKDGELRYFRPISKDIKIEQ